MDELSLITLAAAKSYTDEHGGGGGGTGNYNDLENLPQIGNVTLRGNKTASDLGLATETALADKADKSAVKNEFLGTLEEWNALTEEQKKAYDTYQITNDYTEGSGGLPDYSTEEQKTGRKWVDGKDIYAKVIVLATPQDVNGNAWLSNIDVTGGETLINCVALNTLNYVFPFGGGFTNGELEILNVRNSAIQSIDKVIVEYTKTT